MKSDKNGIRTHDIILVTQWFVEIKRPIWPNRSSNKRNISTTLSTFLLGNFQAFANASNQGASSSQYEASLMQKP
jgi:hypothetical protein